MNAPVTHPEFPSAESEGGWLIAASPEETRLLGGMEPAALDLVCRREDWWCGGDSWALAIVRHGVLVREHFTFNVLPSSRFDIWSCTKSFTATAWGLLIDERPDLSLDSRLYELLLDGSEPTDPRKRDITLGHLLSMTSGIPGESAGAIGTPTAPDVGPFEHALGYAPNRYGISVAELQDHPGRRWDYSDPAYAHLSPLFAEVAGCGLDDYLRRRVLDPIGVEELSWTSHGGGRFAGPHANAHTGIIVSARELARFGYLMLRDGVWSGERLIPADWLRTATHSSQRHNPSYGYGWWTNDAGSWLPDLPRETFAAVGYRSNRCYVVPSLDLVVVRVGTGPGAWDEGALLRGVIDAVVHD